MATTTTDPRSLRELFTDLLDEVRRLFRDEARLLQAESAEKLSQVQTALVSIAVGLVVAACALLILLQAVVVGLSNAMAPWLASLVVGVVVAVIAFILVRVGMNRLKGTNLMPSRTIESVRISKNEFKEKVS